MADCAHNVSLMALIVDGVAHGFSVNGQAFVLPAIGLVPVLQSAVQMYGIHADQNIPDNGQARYDVASVFVSAAKSFSGILSKAIGPIRDGQIAAHSAQGCPGGNS